MPRSDEQKEFRLKPRKPAARARSEVGVWSTAFKTVIHYARTSRAFGKASRPAKSNFRRQAIARNQRCAIRVTYARAGVRGQWRAHGRYIARESAAGNPAEAGFDRTDHSVDTGARLNSWQASGDERLWKIIVSPEFGDRIDLPRLTRDLMNRIGREQSIDLDWVAVAHFNTEHPHVHVALRGVGAAGEPVHLKREYVKQGIRSIAEDLCTRQIGHRTDLDAAEAERREIGEKRFTSLDRTILQKARAFSDNSAETLAIAVNLPGVDRNERSRIHEKHLAARLAVLEDMGLAGRSGRGSWSVRADLESVLRNMQRIGDRQNVIAAHGALMSDERLPVDVLDWQKTESVEGRILVHGEDEISGRSYLMLEGVDARIYLIDYTTELQAGRRQGKLGINSFARLRRVFGGGRSRIEYADFGDSDAMLRDRRRLELSARELVNRGILPTEDGWGGWLGRYQAALRKAAMELQYPVHTRQRVKQRDRSTER